MIFKRKEKKQEAEQRSVGRDAIASNTQDSSRKHITIINNYYSCEFNTPHFSGIKHSEKTEKAERKEWENQDAVYSYSKPRIREAAEFNDYTPDTLKLIQEYRLLFNLLDPRDKGIFLCVCKVMAAEDAYAKSKYPNHDKDRFELEKIVRIKNQVEDAYRERFKRMYNRMRSGLIKNVEIPEIEKLMKSYSGEKLQLVFYSNWNGRLTNRDDHNIFINEWIDHEHLLGGLYDRFQSVSSVCVYVKRKEAIKWVKKVLEDGFDKEEYEIIQEERPEIAKFKAAKFTIRKINGT